MRASESHGHSILPCTAAALQWQPQPSRAIRPTRRSPPWPASPTTARGGVDTLVFTGVYDDYSILLKDTGNIKTVVSWHDGSVDTKWIERFVFADGVYDVTTDLFEPNTPPPPTFISVVATDGVGTEASGDEPDFTFTFTRTGDTSQALTVNYSVAGAPPTFPITFNAAQPGVDIAAPERDHHLRGEQRHRGAELQCH
jgi:hypothetical protein